MTTGKQLQLRRIALDVTASDLAAVIGVPPSSVSRWENARRVTDKAAARYLEALATFGTIPTVDVTMTGPEAAA
jgi:transcriptional regulator with XRE-family HTH domain